MREESSGGKSDKPLENSTRKLVPPPQKNGANFPHLNLQGEVFLEENIRNLFQM
eukprot:UN12548